MVFKVEFNALFGRMGQQHMGYVRDDIASRPLIQQQKSFMFIKLVTPDLITAWQRSECFGWASGRVSALKVLNLL